MIFYKISILAAIFLLSSFSLINATPSNLLNEVSTTVEILDGGPRDVVQTMVDVTVFQPTATPLTITILKSNGETVSTTTTSSLVTIISLSGLTTGSYVIETVDEFDVIQLFPITIE